MGIFSKRTVVVTHNGMFHADDAFAVATLSLLNNGCIKVIRSRDPQDWAKGDFVVDVGGIHDSVKKIYDHHQIGGAGARSNGVPYAGFGLTWKYHGKDVCGSKEVADWVDGTIVQGIDAGDNGYPLTKSISSAREYVLADAISAFRDSSRVGAQYEYVDFLKAVEFAKGILSREIKRATVAVNETNKVLGVYQKTTDKRLIILDEDLFWESALRSCPEPLFAVFPDSINNWRVKAIQEDGFRARKDLPESWAGLRDADLAKVTGVPDAVFAHVKRFMAVAKSKEGAIALAKKALEE